MCSYGVVLWEILTGGKPDKAKGLRLPKCGHIALEPCPWLQSGRCGACVPLIHE